MSEVQLLRFDPEVPQPGSRVRVMARAQDVAFVLPPLTVSVFDSAGQLVVEVEASVAASEITADFVVPTRARDGAYEVRIGRDDAALEGTLTVLSASLEQRLVVGSRGQAMLDEAGALAASGEIGTASDRLRSAESAFQDAGWPHFEVEAVLDRAKLSTQADEARQLRRRALGLLNRVGKQYRDQGARARAVPYYRRAIALAEELSEPRERAINENNLGEVLMYQRFVDERFLDEAQASISAALAYGERTGARDIAAKAIENLAAISALHHRFAESLALLERAFGLVRELPEHREAAVRIEEKLRQLRQALSARSVDVGIVPGGSLEAPTDLSTILSEVVAGLRATAEAASVSVHLEVAQALPTVAVEPARLRAVIERLLANALRTARRETVLTVVAAAEERSGGPGVCVRVSEMSLPPEVLNQIFEPFARSQVTVSRGRAGEPLDVWLPATLR